MAKKLWSSSRKRKQNANLTKFMDFLDKTRGKKIHNYEELYQWSIENISEFWSAVWDFCDIKSSKLYHRVVSDENQMPGVKWFEGAELNSAENLLRFRGQKPALIFKGEGQEIRKVSYNELYELTARLAKSMRESGIQKGDRVAGFLPNMPETVVAMLATTSIGAVWSSCSPDFGIKGALDRFSQIFPKMLFCADGYYYNGKKFNSLEKVSEIIKNLPSLEKIIVVPYAEKNSDVSRLPSAVNFYDFISQDRNAECVFEQVTFDHPVYIMYTSGTTGLPKCIVQGSGVLINHFKELKLHTDVKADDVIFYYTTCGWMMWNWLVSSLALGATIVLFDGSPFYPDTGALFQLAEDLKITIFGTSAKYLSELEKRGAKPGWQYNLQSLQTILSTGSPLSEASFEYVYRDIKKDVLLASISGGTDLNGCFALGNSLLPVYSGELQCRALGMKVEVFDDEGNSIAEQQGELVCTAPFPSAPLFFWNDQNNQKYQEAYFEKYPGIWCHGDIAKITKTGSMVIYGRSDDTLKPAGVRIGTAEIYRQMETIQEVSDSIAVGQDWQGDNRVILFVKMKEGIELTEELVNKIKLRIRENATPRHVPAKVIAVPDIPYTFNGKKVASAVKNAIHGKPIKNLNAIANPEALEFYKNILELQED